MPDIIKTSINYNILATQITNNIETSGGEIVELTHSISLEHCVVIIYDL